MTAKRKIPDFNIASHRGLTLGLPPSPILWPLLTPMGNTALKRFYAAGDEVLCILCRIDVEEYSDDLVDYVKGTTSTLLHCLEAATVLCKYDAYSIGQNPSLKKEDRIKLIQALKALDADFIEIRNLCLHIKNFEVSLFVPPESREVYAHRDLINHFHHMTLLYSRLQRKIYNVAEVITSLPAHDSN